jgi:phosphoenolpyruvate---glycerone phosphotransferase subunit DhaK
MKKFMNTADTMVADSLEGFVAAHEDIVMFCPQRKCIKRRSAHPGKVALISGGGAGHEPLHVGFVGHGMLDAACTGHIFTSPTPDQILAAVETTDTGAGCLLIVKNYDGDIMNFEMAAEAARDRHDIEMLLVGDDVASRLSNRAGKRGVAGTMVIEKLLGEAAERGMPLAALHSLGVELGERIFTMGVALRGASVPELRRPTFTLEPDEMEIGIGIHGEAGRSRRKYAGAEAVAREICDEILAARGPDLPGQGLLLINGLGGTPPAELYLMYGLARQMFEAAGIKIARSLVGTFVTSLDMQGVSITLALLDEAQFTLWDAPVHTAALRWN